LAPGRPVSASRPYQAQMARRPYPIPWPHPPPRPRVPDRLRPRLVARCPHRILRQHRLPRPHPPPRARASVCLRPPPRGRAIRRPQRLRTAGRPHQPLVVNRPQPPLRPPPAADRPRVPRRAHRPRRTLVRRLRRSVRLTSGGSGRRSRRPSSSGRSARRRCWSAPPCGRWRTTRWCCPSAPPRSPGCCPSRATPTSSPSPCTPSSGCGGGCGASTATAPRPVPKRRGKLRARRPPRRPPARRNHPPRRPTGRRPRAARQAGHRSAARRRAKPGAEHRVAGHRWPTLRAVVRRPIDRRRPVGAGSRAPRRRPAGGLRVGLPGARTACRYLPNRPRRTRRPTTKRRCSPSWTRVRASSSTRPHGRIPRRPLSRCSPASWAHGRSIAAEPTRMSVLTSHEWESP